MADEVGALFMVDMAHIAGLVATDLHPNPVPITDFVTTTTHKTLRGTRGGMIFCKEEYAQKIDKAIFPGLQGRPLMHIIAAKVVVLKEALSDDFKKYQQQIITNAAVMAATLQDYGLRLVSGGTDNHLMPIDLTDTGVTGKQTETALDKVSITVNKNTVPFETKSPFVTSGIRLGTPAITTKGMKEQEVKLIAKFIYKVIDNIDNKSKLEEIREQVYELTDRF